MKEKKLPELPEREPQEELVKIKVVRNLENTPASYIDADKNTVLALTDLEAMAYIYSKVTTMAEDIDNIKKLLK